MSHGISQVENRAMVWKKHQTFAGGASGAGDMLGAGTPWFVDGDIAASKGGKSWDAPFKTIQEGITAASAGDVVYVMARTITDYTGDPTSYDENLIIPFATSSLAIIGISRGRTQGGLPQVKIGSGSTAMLKIRAPGCLIMNMGFNGAGSTGGGILLDDDYATKSAFGTSIIGCHFKNCIVTDCSDGGAIYTTTAGNAWQLLVSGCSFYKNACDIALLGTSNTVPQDWVIEDCIFSGPAASVDTQLNLKGGSGVNGVTINNCTFPVLGTLVAGTINRFADLTGCVGSLTNCTFGCVTDAAGTELTFKAAGTAVFLPTTVFMTRCYGQSVTDGVTGECNIS